MKAFIIGNKDSEISMNAVENCRKSVNLDIEFVQQTSPDTLEEDNFDGLVWKYPLSEEQRVDEETGMTLRGYTANDVDKVFACTISHARIWQKCVVSREDTMVLEHDAIFTREFEQFDWSGGVLGLNDPRGATHNSGIYHNLVSLTDGVKDAPFVLPETSLPQGLAGNSAYIIKPYFAYMLLEKLRLKGGWPNDSLMCKQFFPYHLKVVYPYYTTLQGVPSTTTS